MSQVDLSSTVLRFVSSESAKNSKFCESRPFNLSSLVWIWNLRSMSGTLLKFAFIDAFDSEQCYLCVFSRFHQSAISDKTSSPSHGCLEIRWFIVCSGSFSCNSVAKTLSRDNNNSLWWVHAITVTIIKALCKSGVLRHQCVETQTWDDVVDFVCLFALPTKKKKCSYFKFSVNFIVFLSVSFFFSTFSELFSYISKVSFRNLFHNLLETFPKRLEDILNFVLEKYNEFRRYSETISNDFGRFFGRGTKTKHHLFSCGWFV